MPDGANATPVTPPMTRPMAPRWDLVALTVGFRRQQLGLSVDEIAAHVGVSADAWNELEGGRRPRGFHRDEARRAASVLGWTDDSLDRIVRGHRPLDASGVPPTVPPAPIPAAAAAPAPARVPVAETEIDGDPGRGAPWILAPVSTRDRHRVRHVDPARLGVLGGLLILVVVIVVFFS